MSHIAGIASIEQPNPIHLLEEGSAFEKQRQLEKALLCFDKAIQLDSNLGNAHFYRGNVLLELGRAETSIAAYRKALELKPDSAATYYNIGNAYLHLSNPADAAAAYHKAIELKPDFADAEVAIGGALEELGQFNHALIHYQRAIAIQPDYAEAHYNLGGVWTILDQLDNAVISYQLATVIKPDYAEAHYNLGTTFHQLKECENAIASYKRAIEIKPDYAEAHNNLGATLEVLRKFGEATASYQRALTIKADFLEALCNIGLSLQYLGKLDAAQTCIRRALEINPEYSSAHSNLLFIQNYMAGQSPSQLLAEAQRFGEVVARLARPYNTWSNSAEVNRCLRIGLVSGDLGDHPVGFFVDSVLSALAATNADRLEIFVYSNRFCSGEINERLKACCRRWYSAVGVSDKVLAQRIHEDTVDILIDLSGHTGLNRLPVFAWKPAPIQVSWLGYFATTGVTAIDYLIADPWTLPPSEEPHFTEAIWRLPETRLCFTPPNVAVDVSALPALNNGYLTFGCFNNLSKMNEDVVALWARVLTAVPNSRLLLKAPQLGEASTQKSVMESFAAHYINCDRLIFESYVPRADYLAAYQRVDIALDPFPYPGGTTTVEALWMGVPVLTLTGERFLARQGVGLLMNAGLPDWVATDPDDYVARAVAHASDLQRLAALRSRLRAHVLASPIFDAPRFAKHFESALRDMWKIWCEKQG